MTVPGEIEKLLVWNIHHGGGPRVLRLRIASSATDPTSPSYVSTDMESGARCSVTVG
jgi:hypothetical protein